MQKLFFELPYEAKKRPIPSPDRGCVPRSGTSRSAWEYLMHTNNPGHWVLRGDPAVGYTAALRSSAGLRPAPPPPHCTSTR